MINDGYLITTEDLESIWDPVETIFAIRNQRTDDNTTTLNFDGWTDDAPLTDPGIGIRLIIPSVDAKLVGITVVTGSSTEDGTITFSLSGNIQETLTFTAPVVSGSTQTRANVTIPPGVFGLLGGDTITLQITTSSGLGNPVAIVRVHLVYRTLWSKS